MKLARMRKAIEAFKGLRVYNKAQKLSYEGHHQEALDTFAEVKGNAEYVAKAELKSAGVLSRRKRYPDAVRRYSSFLSNHIDKIDAGPNCDYLRAYAAFYCDAALRQNGQVVPAAISVQQLRELGAKASYVERHEFLSP